MAAVVEVAEWPQEAPEARVGEEEAVAVCQSSQSPGEVAAAEEAKDARAGCVSAGFRYWKRNLQQNNKLIIQYREKNSRVLVRTTFGGCRNA